MEVEKQSATLKKRLRALRTRWRIGSPAAPGGSGAQQDGGSVGCSELHAGTIGTRNSTNTSLGVGPDAVTDDGECDASVIEGRSSRRRHMTLPSSVKGEDSQMGEHAHDAAFPQSQRSHRTFSDCCKFVVKSVGKKAGRRSRARSSVPSRGLAGHAGQEKSRDFNQCEIGSQSAEQVRATPPSSLALSGTTLALESVSGNGLEDSRQSLQASSSCLTSADKRASLSSCGLSDRSTGSPGACSRSSTDIPDNSSDGMLTARPAVGHADRPLPLPPRPTFASPISTAVRSAVAREISRTVARRATVHVLAAPMQRDGSDGEQQPPPVPARPRLFSADDISTPPRRGQLPPTPPPRNVPESRRRNGNVYEDPEALERAFGPLRDVGRWYRSLAAQQLAFSALEISEDGWATLGPTRRTRAMTSPHGRSLPGPAGAVRTPQHARDRVEVIYERRPASPTHTSLLEGLEGLVKQGWYWGPVSRVEAEDILEGLADGTFLVRDSTDDRYLLSLSFRSVGRTLHTRVQHFHGSFSFYENPGRSGRCSTVVDLVESALEKSQVGAFCHSSPTRNQASIPVRLLHAHSRFRTMRSLQQQCRFVIRQATRYDLICELPLPKMMHSYLLESPFTVS